MAGAQRAPRAPGNSYRPAERAPSLKKAGLVDGHGARRAAAQPSASNGERRVRDSERMNQAHERGALLDSERFSLALKRERERERELRECDPCAERARISALA